MWTLTNESRFRSLAAEFKSAGIRGTRHLPTPAPRGTGVRELLNEIFY